MIYAFRQRQIRQEKFQDQKNGAERRASLGEVKREEVLAEIGLPEYKYLALGEIWRIFGFKQSKYASKRQADQFILYRDIYDLAVSVCKEWNVPLPDHGTDSNHTTLYFTKVYECMN